MGGGRCGVDETEGSRCGVAAVEGEVFVVSGTEVVSVMDCA